jgi:hypothetical protein
MKMKLMNFSLKRILTLTQFALLSSLSELNQVNAGPRKCKWKGLTYPNGRSLWIQKAQWLY